MDSTKSSASPAHPPADETIEAHYTSLERLEERLAHELMADDERQELRDRVLRLRRRATQNGRRRTPSPAPGVATKP